MQICKAKITNKFNSKAFANNLNLKDDPQDSENRFLSMLCIYEIIRNWVHKSLNKFGSVALNKRVQNYLPYV